MKWITLPALALALAAFTSPCVAAPEPPSAESPIDDNALAAEEGRRFELGPADKAAVRHALYAMLDDVKNVRMSDVSARRNGPGPTDFDFCGLIFDLKTTGYIDRTTMFYGTRVGEDITIKVGREADAPCRARVSNSPQPSRAHLFAEPTARDRERARQLLGCWRKTLRHTRVKGGPFVELCFEENGRVIHFIMAELDGWDNIGIYATSGTILKLQSEDSQAEYCDYVHMSTKLVLTRCDYGGHYIKQ